VRILRVSCGGAEFIPKEYLHRSLMEWSHHALTRIAEEGRQYHEVADLRLTMIPPGYDDTRFYPVSAATRARLRRKFGFDGKVILALGRIARKKGYDLLIRAFAEVARRETAARLHLAIGGMELEPAEQRILDDCRSLAGQLGLGSRVAFSGLVPDTDLADLDRAADVFVVSSRYEPFGMTAVEAMACGTPTVATTRGGLFRCFVSASTGSLPTRWTQWI
jgi:mannosylfructose-phosphate synthase